MGGRHTADGLQRKIDINALRYLAKKYIWWKTVEDSLEYPERVIAQVMDIGDYDDVQALAETVGDECLKQVLTQATIGQFRPQSWSYWHYRLGLVENSNVPELPSKRFG